MITLTVVFPDRTEMNIDESVRLANDKKWCAVNAIFTVDGISFFPAYDINHKPFVFAVNNDQTSNKIIYRMEDNTIIQSSMSEYSLVKFKRGYSKNRNLLIREAGEVSIN